MLQEATINDRRILIDEKYVKLAGKILEVNPSTGNTDVIHNQSFNSIWLILKQGKYLKDLEKNEMFLELVKKYKFEVIELEQDKIQLKSSMFLNTDLLYDKFRLEIVERISLNNDAGMYLNNAHRFSIKYKNAHYTLVYSNGWGDCPAGCIHWQHKEYLYNIKENKITFIQTYGNTPQKIIKD